MPDSRDPMPGRGKSGADRRHDALAQKYGVHRCRDCGAQLSGGRECVTCGAPISRREWIEVVPASAYEEAVVIDDAATERMIRLLRDRYGWATEVCEAEVGDLLDAAKGGGSSV